MQLGVKRGTVRIEAYSKDWAQAFELEKQILLKIFKDNFLAIEHIGSTSIPNLIAKPLIDIAIQVEDIDQLNDIPNLLVSDDYIERLGRLSGRQKVFAKEGDDHVTHHLHIIEKGEQDWEDKIKFRDILIKQPEIAKAYALLKKELFEKHANNRSEYTKGKAAFIQSIIH